ncbi:hypothetical protein GCM10023219_06640 [Stakelama sediminis]
MAAQGFKGFGWLLGCLIVALSCYLVTSRVAAERARLDSVQRSIVDARKDIRDLDTEFKTRANMAQLERWNGQLFALAAPTPDQYLDPGAQGVAELDSGQFGKGDVQVAALIVPRAPVLTDGADAPSAIAAPASAIHEKEPEARIQTAAVTDSRPTASSAVPAVQATQQKVAMLDRKLLSDSTLGDLMKGAKMEAGLR